LLCHVGERRRLWVLLLLLLLLLLILLLTRVMTIAPWRSIWTLLAATMSPL
jgi:hypothetical protein